jgi:K+-sensing histidine kinase KdpD
VKFKLKDFVFDGQECSMVILEDRTSQKVLKKLEFNNRMAKMPASCVSHDMRAPLGAIDQLVEQVISMPRLSRRVVNLLRPVKCASRILKTQVNNLLDYSLL